MTIELMTNKSPSNYLTKDTTVVGTRTGVLKNATSVTNPTVMFESNGQPLPANVNYFHIPAFNRYYFVTDITSVTTNMYAITGHVDVLVSFRDAINKCSGVVQRQENSFNLYLDDGIFKCYQNPKIQLKTFPSGFQNPSYILLVAGNQK